MNADGKIVLETMVPTAAAAIREMIESLSGPLHVTSERPIEKVLPGLDTLLEGRNLKGNLLSI